ncbi:MAG: aspartate kinase [Dehalococcoidia bacterium]|nr:aspartate kinase [Dehalococcoidia bacterium]
MTILVQKYGGSSVANADSIKRVAKRIAETAAAGHQVVGVVSAMGDTTDELINLARQVNTEPSDRELDLLLSTGETVSCTLMAMALRSMGQQAIALTGPQAGIRTDAAFRQAQIVEISPERMLRELGRGTVPIVAGFQGMTDDMDVTTLGRGGSDTTAVALAVALGAEHCEINTDVEGVYTADPRLVPTARKLDVVRSDEMLELARHGARVMHPRAVELGDVYGMPIVVRSSFSDESGTLISRGGDMALEARQRVRGIAHDVDVGRVTVVAVPDRPGIAFAIFDALAQAAINVDIIVQNVGREVEADLSFTVSRDILQSAADVVRPVAEGLGAKAVLASADLAKISIVGSGLSLGSGYAARMFEALADANVNITSITTSEIRITCLIAEEDVPRAARSLHAAFDLEEELPANGAS